MRDSEPSLKHHPGEITNLIRRVYKCGGDGDGRRVSRSPYRGGCAEHLVEFNPEHLASWKIRLHVFSIKEGRSGALRDFAKRNEVKYPGMALFLRTLRGEPPPANCQ